MQYPDIETPSTTTITTAAAAFKVGEVVRKDWGPGPVGFLRVTAVTPTTIGVDQQPGNRHERRKRWALARKGTRA